jgi:hypothetical protein
MYIFPESRWVSLAQLTKAELLDSHQSELTRIIHDHDGDWILKLQRQLKMSPWRVR